MTSQSFRVRPYWWDEAMPAEEPEMALDSDCDVAIVGSGYTGLHAAVALARAGRSVQVFDKENPGFGCSSRNGGIVSGTTKFDLTELIRNCGLEQAKEIFSEGLEAEAWLTQFIGEENIDCAYTKTGRFVAAYRASHMEHMMREADVVNQHFDRGLALVPRAEQRSEIGSDHYHGGMTDPTVAGLHPALYLAGLLRLARTAGVKIHGRCAVRGYVQGASGVIVETARGTVKARDLIVATNGYTEDDLPWLHCRLVRVASQIIVTEPLPGDMAAQLIPKNRMVVDTRKLFHYYRLSPDGTRVVFGGRGGAWSNDARTKVRVLQRNLVTIFPELATTAISHVWWGNVAFPFDFKPKLSLVDGVHYAAGYCGSGVVWASWFGHLVARRIISDSPVTTPLGGDPFRTRPLYSGKPWFLPAMIGWYRIKDMIG